MLCTIRTFTDNGPYFPSTKGNYQASCLRDLLFHVRLCMADREDIIGLFGPDGECRGIFHLEIEGHCDSAGDSIIDYEGYELLRPNGSRPWLWQYLLKQL